MYCRVKTAIISVNNMRIAFFHELHKGGARRGTNDFAKQLKKRGHVVDLYTISPKVKEEKEFYSNAKIYQFLPVIWKGRNWRKKLYKDTVELIKLVLLERRIADDIGRKKYDLVFVAASQYIESPFLLQFLKTPSLFYCNDPYYRIIYEPELFRKESVNFFKIKYELLNRLARKYLDKWNISKATYVAANSKFTKELFEKTYKKKADVLYYGIDTLFFVPRKFKKNIDLLFVGSYDFLDGYPFFKEVLKHMQTKPKVRAVVFEDEWLTDLELKDVYQRTKILVAPAYKEPLGLVPLEAMACGAVVVAVDEGAHKETVVNGKTGVLLKRDAMLFAKKLDGLLNDSDTLKKMSLEARSYVSSQWSWKKRGNNLERYIQSKFDIK